jgi:hypothetical protein
MDSQRLKRGEEFKEKDHGIHYGFDTWTSGMDAQVRKIGGRTQMYRLRPLHENLCARRTRPQRGRRGGVGKDVLFDKEPGRLHWLRSLWPNLQQEGIQLRTSRRLERSNAMAQLREIERLEDIFETLRVEFDQRVIDLHRMRILRRFGQEIQKIDDLVPRPNEEQVRTLYAAALAKIYEQCRRGTREPEPVFRGLSQQLVQLRRRP